MKKNYFFFIAYLFAIIQNVNSQEEQLDCGFNLREALFYLKGDENIEKDSVKAVEYLKPCLDVGNANAQLIMGRLHLANGTDESLRKAFKLYKKSAKQDNPIAAAELGMMFKYGWGCNLNFNKARKWFKKGANLGNDKAAYSLGYLFLKGFGDIDQDYTKAVQWFRKSEHPMARYWLGVCYYYGYGVQQDIQKANEILGTNFEEVNINNDISTSNSESSIINNFEEVVSDSEENIISEDISETNILGKWSGSLLKYDWSGKYIEQKHSINIEFKYDSINENTIYSISVNEQEFSGDLNRLENAVYFENIQIKLPHNSFNQKIPNEVNYDLLSSDLKIKKLENLTFLTGNFDNFIHSFNEPGTPLKFVLKKKETFSNSDDEISDDILQALAQQEENFIKLYPNPFQSDLVISYTLDSPSLVQVKITDVNGSYNSIIEQGEQQKAGKHRYFFNGNGLKKGIYIVTVLTNNQRKTRIIVKK